MKQDLLIDIKVDTASVNKAIEDIEAKIAELKKVSITTDTARVKELESTLKGLKQTAQTEGNSLTKREKSWESFYKKLEAAYRRKEKAESEGLKKMEDLEKSYNSKGLALLRQREQEEKRIANTKLEREKSYNAKGMALLRQREQEEKRIQERINKEANKGNSLGSQIMGGIIGGNLITTGISATIAVMKDAFHTIKDYSGAVAELRATTISATKAEQDFLVQMSLSDQSIFSAKDIIKADTELAKRGYNASEIALLSPNIMQGSQAFGASPDDVADLVGSTLSIYKKGAESSKEVTDQLAKAADISALSFENLKLSLATVAPVAKSYGFELSETLALMATVKDAGFNASTGATALRNIFLHLADPAGNLAKRLKEPVTDMESLVKGLNQLEKEGVDLTSALDLTDRRAVSTFLSLLNSSDGLIKKNGEIRDSYGFVEEKSKIMSDSLEGDVQRAGKAWDNFFLKIAEGDSVFTGITRASTQFFTDLMKGLTNLDIAFTKTKNLSEEQKERIYDNAKGTKYKHFDFAQKNITSPLIYALSAGNIDIQSDFGNDDLIRNRTESYFKKKENKNYQSLSKKELFKKFKEVPGMTMETEEDIELLFSVWYKRVQEQQQAVKKAKQSAKEAELKKKTDKKNQDEYNKTHLSESQIRANEKKAEQEYYANQKKIALEATERQEKEKADNEKQRLLEKQADAELELLKIRQEREIELGTTSSNRLKKELDVIEKIRTEEIKRAELEVKNPESQDEKNALKAVTDVINEKSGNSSSDAIKRDSDEKATNSQTLESIRIGSKIDLLEPWEIEERYKLENELLTSKYEFELHALEAKNDSTLILKAEYDAEVIKREKTQADTLEEIKRQEIATRTQAVGDMLSTIASLYSEDTKKHKRLATASSLINMFVGMGEITAKHAASPITAGILQAKLLVETAVNIAKINKVKFEKGGYIHGNRHASGGVDLPTANVEGGEFVNNRESTYRNLPLLQSINQRGKHVDIQAENDAKLIRMLSNLPSPVVSVKEITSLQKKVTTKESISM
jgi:TP901 family phage tail tape measure protein